MEQSSEWINDVQGEIEDEMLQVQVHQIEKGTKKNWKRGNRDDPKRDGGHAKKGRRKRLGEIEAAESSLE